VAGVSNGIERCGGHAAAVGAVGREGYRTSGLLKVATRRLNGLEPDRAKSRLTNINHEANGRLRIATVRSGVRTPHLVAMQPLPHSQAVLTSTEAEFSSPDPLYDHLLDKSHPSTRDQSTVVNDRPVDPDPRGTAGPRVEVRSSRKIGELTSELNGHYRTSVEMARLRRHASAASEMRARFGPSCGEVNEVLLKRAFEILQINLVITRTGACGPKRIQGGGASGCHVRAQPLPRRRRRLNSRSLMRTWRSSMSPEVTSRMPSVLQTNGFRPLMAG